MSKAPTHHVSFRIDHPSHEKAMLLGAARGYTSVSQIARTLTMEYLKGNLHFPAPLGTFILKEVMISHEQAKVTSLSADLETATQRADFNHSQALKAKAKTASMERELSKLKAAFAISEKADAQALVSAKSETRTWRAASSGLALVLMVLMIGAIHHEVTRYSPPSIQPPAMKPVTILTTGYIEQGKWKSFEDGREITVYGWKPKKD